MQPNLIFIYGTLRSAFDNEWARLLRESAEFVGMRTVTGSIYRVNHYPGYREEPAGVVKGELYRATEAVLAKLDEYEGEEFERVLTNQGWWIYRYRFAPTEDTRIASGDFLEPDSR